MRISFFVAVSVWFGFLFLLTLSLGAVARSFSGSLTGRRVPPKAFPRWKRALDLFCLALMLPVILPFGALVALVVRFSSRGPVFFAQERIGFLGQPFQCYKFRTMAAAGDTRSHQAHVQRLLDSNAPMTKLDDAHDPRIIPGGRLLRATGLDELPQLFNVLRGEMSLVGPRPSLRYEFERFNVEQRQRANVLPGLTGLWQVSGKNNTTFPQMIELDIAYGKSMSLLCDIGILFRTVFVVLEQTALTVRRKRARKNSTEGEGSTSAPPIAKSCSLQSNGFNEVAGA